MALDTSRRRLLAAFAGAAGAGLAGCLGRSDGGASDGTSSPTAVPPTASGSGTTTPADGDPFCRPLTGSPTPYNTAGTPFVFTFDYVDSWTVEEPFRNGGSLAQRMVTPTLSTDGGDATVRVAQGLSPVTAATAAEDVQYVRDRQDDNGVTYETEFNGETIEFVEFPNAAVNSYYTHLPHGDGEERYYRFSIVTILDTVGSDRNIGDCTDAVNTATQTTLESIAPNPETTVEEVRTPV